VQNEGRYRQATKSNMDIIKNNMHLISIAPIGYNLFLPVTPSLRYTMPQLEGFETFTIDVKINAPVESNLHLCLSCDI
jgi:hypothetical protein